MSVFKTNEDPIEKRVKVLEKKVREIEALLGKKTAKAEKKEEKEEDEFCVIT